MFFSSTFLRVVTSIVLVVGLFYGSGVGFAALPDNAVIDIKTISINNAQIRKINTQPEITDADREEITRLQGINSKAQERISTTSQESQKNLQQAQTDLQSKTNQINSIQGVIDKNNQLIKDFKDTGKNPLNIEDWDAFVKGTVKLETQVVTLKETDIPAAQKAVNTAKLVNDENLAASKVMSSISSSTEKEAAIDAQIADPKTPKDQMAVLQQLKNVEQKSRDFIMAQSTCPDTTQPCGQDVEKAKAALTSAQEDSSTASNFFTNKQQIELAKNSKLSLCTLGMCIGNVYQGKNDPIEYTAAKIIRFAARIIAPLAVLAIIVGGMMIIMSVGSEDMVTKGKDIVLYSVIALIGVFSAWVIVTLIQQALYSLGV